MLIVKTLNSTQLSADVIIQHCDNDFLLVMGQWLWAITCHTKVKLIAQQSLSISLPVGCDQALQASVASRKVPRRPNRCSSAHSVAIATAYYSFAAVIWACMVWTKLLLQRPLMRLSLVVSCIRRQNAVYGRCFINGADIQVPTIYATKTVGQWHYGHRHDSAPSRRTC